MKKVCSVKDSNFNSKNHIIFICDHATNNIDKKYRNQFVNTKILDSHVAYDIGAKSLTLNLTKKLKQSCIYSNFSRLLIDPNRKKTDKDSIVSSIFGVSIPINNKIDKKEKDLRVKNFYNIYHNKIYKNGDIFSECIPKDCLIEMNKTYQKILIEMLAELYP